VTMFANGTLNDVNFTRIGEINIRST